MVRYQGVLLVLAASLLSTSVTSASEQISSSLTVTDTSTGSELVLETTEIIIISYNGGGTSDTQHYNSNQTMATTGTTHQVTVGGANGLVYTPNNITAAVGDIVQFNFESENHTVTQSSFATPCKQVTSGVDSGFMPNPNNSVSPAPMMQLQVTTSTPIWMYCAQTGHCGQGMVFAINPTAEETYTAFREAAIAQNGTTTAATNTTSVSASSSSSAVAVAASSSAAASATSASASSSTSTAAAVATQGTAEIVSGTGTLSTGDACSCSCLCGAADFPAGAGIGAVGGVGGQLPLPSA